MIKLNTVIQGDCLEVMSNIDDVSIDMILCDLPYGTTACSWDIVIPFDILWKHYTRIIKPNSAIVLTASQPFTSLLIESNIKLFKYTWVWEKSKATGFLNAKKRPLVAHEDIVVFSKGTPPYFPQMTQGLPYNKGVRKQQTENDVYGKFNCAEVKSEGGRYPRSVQYFKTAESEGEVLHKSQKPLSLFEYMVKTYSIDGDTVLDNCAGSFTTALACENTNRNWICIDDEEEHCEIGRKRIKENRLRLHAEANKLLLPKQAALL